MARSVRLSAKTARWLLDMYERAPASNNVVVQELRAALAKLSRVRTRKAPTKKAKTAKRKTKRQATKDVHAAVWARSGGRCEACEKFLGSFDPGEMDHFEGKARSESAETCWRLCASCHRRKHAAEPSRASWLRAFLAHCCRYDYTAPALKASDELEAEADIQTAAAISKAVSP